MTVDVYTEAEYKQHFENGAWTKEQTDELFFLCQRLDTRFGTIADRLGERTVEDVKARYYTIARKLLDVRGKHTDDQLASMPLYRFNYDKDYDVRRKAQLNQLHKRTPADEAEEAKLVAELKAIDETLKKDKKIRTQQRRQQEQELIKAQGGVVEEEEEAPRRRQERDTVTSRRPQREIKRKVNAAPAYPARPVKVPRSGVAVVEVNDTNEMRLQHKLDALGVDEWPLPFASATISHSALLEDLNKLIALERKVEQL